jgi:hypothetical protein
MQWYFDHRIAMTTCFPITDLLNELSPDTKGNQEALVKAMKEHYRLGGFEPEVTMAGAVITVQVDDQQITGFGTDLQ